MAVVAPVSKTVDIVEIDVSNMTIYKKTLSEDLFKFI